VKDVPLSQTKGLWPGSPLLHRPPSESPGSPASSPATERKATQNLPAAPAKIAQFVDTAEEIKRLREEIVECRQSLEQWTRAETAWSNQRRLFKVMTENVTDLIVLMDGHGNRVWNNPAYSHALGYKLEELAGSYAFSEVHPEDRPIAVEAFEQAVAKKANQQAEYRIERKGGGVLDLQTEIVPIFGAEGRIESLVLMAHDITEIKRLTAAGENASGPDTTTGVLVEMARDFNQILTTVFGNLAIARNLNGPHNAVALRLTEMERSLQAARDLIEQMFSLAPNSDRPRTLMPLEPLVHEAVNSVLRGTMVRAEYTFARNLPELELDGEGIGHAIRNLITNSFQAMDKGVIRVTAEFIAQEHLSQRPEIPLKPGNYVCLRIQDQGCGMSDKVLQQAAEPYFTTHPGAQGLGLTTALSAVQRMGGTILLDSTEKVGTTAYVYLPVSHAPKKNHAVTGALPKPMEKRRILLMDDEQMILDIVSRMLVHLGYEVAICTDGAQAIASFAKAKTNNQSFDVVLMDLVIPNGVGGQDAVHTIRKIDPNAKVIASSGHLEHPVMMDFKKFGFVAALEKPYKLERLQQVIDGVIEAAAKASA
jgi:two-component system cell cycle sensor histidine kinase/response regulator CckA